jgi:hypothetical protein
MLPTIKTIPSELQINPATDANTMIPLDAYFGV